MVSSGSDIGRVYVSSVAAGSRVRVQHQQQPSLRRGARLFCNHIRALVGEAVLQYGAERVGCHLKVEAGDGEPDAHSLTSAMTSTRPGSDDTSAAAQVFSRFLRHLAYLELPATTGPLPEMQWFPTAGFPTTGAVAA